MQNVYNKEQCIETQDMSLLYVWSYILLLKWWSKWVAYSEIWNTIIDDNLLTNPPMPHVHQEIMTNNIEIVSCTECDLVPKW